MTRVIKLKIDVTKIDRAKIEERKYTTQTGEEKTQMLYPIDVILVDVPTHVKDYENSKLVKAGFAVEAQTKAEREAKTKGRVLGDALEFVKVDPNHTSAGTKVPDFIPNTPEQAAEFEQKMNTYEAGEIEPEDIPF